MSERDYTIAAVDRAMRVLEALGDRPDQGITELARNLGLTKSLVFRLISTLEARGYVSRDTVQATFALGYRAATLGEQAERQKALMLAAQDEMDRLSEETAENVNLVVRDGDRSLVIGCREGRHSMRLFAHVGRHGPLHAGGGSTLLLAYAPDDIRQRVLSGELEGFTDKTITDADELARLLKRVQKRGWHVAQDDLDTGAFSVAAPIRVASNRVIAAISVAGALARFDEARRSQYLDAVLDAAARISLKLGSAPTGQVLPGRTENDAEASLDA